MKCAESQVAIQTALERGTPLDAETANHLASCELCRQRHADASLEQLLTGQTVPPPRTGFVDDAIAAAIREGARTRSRFPAWAASIAMIGVVVGLVYGIRPAPDAAEPGAIRVAMTAHEGRNVNVVIDSPVAQPAVTVTIELAPNLELAGFPDEHRIEWQTDLSVGKNLLALPLTLTDDANSHFDVALSYGSKKQNVHVLVLPRAAGAEPTRTNV